MGIENKLNWLKHFDILVKSKRQEIASLRSSVYRSMAFLDHHGQSETSENLNIKIIDQSEQIAKELEQMYQERDRLVKLIDDLSDPLCSVVIRLYYLNDHDWKDISRELSISIRHLQRIRDDGLDELKKSYKNSP